MKMISLYFRTEKKKKDSQMLLKVWTPPYPILHETGAGWTRVYISKGNQILYDPALNKT